MPAIAKNSLEDCISAYAKYGHLGLAAAELGVNKSSLQERLKRAGVLTKGSRREWTQTEDDMLRERYAVYRDRQLVERLAAELSRSVGAICTRAYALGLTGEATRSAKGELVRVNEVDWRAHREELGDALLALGCQDHTVFALRHDGEPISKARSRFTRQGNSYTPAGVAAAQSRLALRFATLDIFRGNVGVGCVFYRSSQQRIDTDNLMKLVLDAGTEGGMWADDSQVTAIVGRTEFDAEHPRTLIVMMPHVSSLTRGSEHWPRCRTCRKQFNPTGRKNPVYCSAACRTRRPDLISEAQLAIDPETVGEEVLDTQLALVA
jgi:Holliday junction resolvase RusA-like endonuclease